MTKRLTFLILWGIFFAGKILHASTPTDQACLANAIFHEANGESILGQRAVGETIINRFHTGKYRNICSVVNEKIRGHWQFGFHYHHDQHVPHERFRYFMGVAESLLQQTSNKILPHNVLFFNNKAMDHKRFHFYCRIGGQKFYTLLTV